MKSPVSSGTRPKKPHDPVTSPKHYTRTNLETIIAMEKEGL